MRRALGDAAGRGTAMWNDELAMLDATLELEEVEL